MHFASFRVKFSMHRGSSQVIGSNAWGACLGLAIVDRISGMLDHPVTVHSTQGKGSTFAVTVPRAPAEQVHASASKAGSNSRRVSSSFLQDSMNLCQLLTCCLRVACSLLACCMLVACLLSTTFAEASSGTMRYFSVKSVAISLAEIDPSKVAYPMMP